MKLSHPYSKTLKKYHIIYQLITTKAVIIPSFKKYMLCVRGLAKFASVLSEDLDKVNAEEADVKEFFDTLQLGSADVKESCTQFIDAMSEVRTDLGVSN